MPRSERGSVGSATVEFALVLPLVLVVVLALVQVGLLVRDRLLVEAGGRVPSPRRGGAAGARGRRRRPG
jgi:hypothetical protein